MADRKRVLLVAEKMELRARIARKLQASGYAVELAGDEKRALRLTADDDFQIVIVALGSSSSSLATMLELRDSVPAMIVLTEGSDEIARVHCSVPGVDVFLLKPSNEDALVTRVNEKIAHGDVGAGEPVPVPTNLYFEDCRLNLAGLVFVHADGREVALTRAEAHLLTELARSPGEVRSRDKLRYAVAGRGVDPFDRSIDMLVARVRRKIEPDPKIPRFLVTVPGVGYKLLAGPQAPSAQKSVVEQTESERRQVTALCCKLVDATRLAVNLDPEDLSEVTSGFRDTVLAEIKRMGGTIAVITPEEILAFFGYPEAHEDDADCAVTAGLGAVEKIADLASPRCNSLQARVGIATGLVLANPKQVVGEPLTIAEGVCDLADPNSVLITASTRNLIGGAFICGAPEQYKLIGVSQTVEACRAIGTQTVESRFKAKRSKNISHLVGRDQELQRLLQVWDRAKRGEGQVVLICGEPGIGKSHLCEFLLEHKADEPYALIRYQCSPQHSNSAFYPIISQLEHAIGFEESDTPETKFHKLAATLSEAVNAPQEDISLYAALLSIASRQSAPLPRETPQRLKELTIDALIRHLLTLADKKLLVITLADVHWADSSTLDLVNKIIPLVAKARILLLIKFRPEFSPKWLGEPHVTMLHLDRLGREQSLAIVSKITGGKTLPLNVKELIIAKADGIPLFIEELTKSVLESERREPARTLAVPPTLLNSLTARLDRLGLAKEVAQMGAVIGREFSHHLLTVVAPGSAGSLEAALTRLANSELISVSGEFPDTVYTFKHALVQDAAYATLSRARRRHLHSRVAHALENSFTFTVETQPELLAYHLGEAGFTERAIDYLRKAGQRSIEHSANAEAVAHLSGALQLLRTLGDTRERREMRFHLEVMLGQAMIACYGYAAPRTRETLLRAKELIDDATDVSQKFAVLYGIWACHYVAGEVAQQQNAAAEFLAEAEHASDAATLCIGHRMVGTTYLTMGEFAAGLRHLQRARTLYKSVHDPGHRYKYGQDIEASILCYLCWALWQLGHIDQALKVAAEAIQVAEKLSHPHTLVYTICHALGFMDLFQRRYEDMQSYAALVISTCRQNGLLHWLNCGMILDGWGAICSSQVDRGMVALRKGIAGWQKGGARLWMPMFLILEAEALAKAGRDEAALQAIERALAICQDSGERWAMAEVMRTKAHLLQSTGRANSREIETLLLASLEIAKGQEAASWELRTSTDLSRLWIQQGRNSEALSVLQSVCDKFTKGSVSADLSNARELLQKLRRNATVKRSGDRSKAHTN